LGISAARFVSEHGYFYPAEPPRGRGGASKSSSGGPGAETEKPLLLVVDDDPETRQFLSLLLERHYQVVAVSGGEPMREQLRLHGGRFCVVLMDLALREPEDGIDLTRWIRTQAAFEHIPVIATTAYASADVRNRALAAGCNAYLAKPFSQYELLRTIENCLPSDA
jgi:CheY-like chemotaxis protein